MERFPRRLLEISISITSSRKLYPHGQKAFTTLTGKSKQAGLVFRALNHKLRQQILFYLIEHPDTAVGALYKKLRLLQSTLSQHLSILRRQGLVQAKRQGQHVTYSVNWKRLEGVDCSCDQLLRVSKPK